MSCADSRGRTSAVATIMALALFGAGCGSDTHSAAPSTSTPGAGASATASRTSACRPVPPAGAALDWLPADLPLPDGSYPIQDVDAAAAPPSVPVSDTHRGPPAVDMSVT